MLIKERLPISIRQRSYGEGQERIITFSLRYAWLDIVIYPWNWLALGAIWFNFGLIPYDTSKPDGQMLFRHTWSCTIHKIWRQSPLSHNGASK